MSPTTVDFHPRAIDEARAARRWYARINASLANRFLDELDEAVRQIVAAPNQWSPHLHGTRVYRLRHFPYQVVFRATALAIQVIAVAHGSRRPGYWWRRIP